MWRISIVVVVLLAAACGHPGHGAPDGGDHGADDGGDDGGLAGDAHGGSGDGGGSGSSVAITTCESNHWLAPISVTGPGILRFHGKTYVFAASGTVWAVVDHATGIATTQAIPLPPGVAVMKAVKAEVALDGTPLVWFLDTNNHYYATRFDGTAFSTPIDVMGANTIHGDAQGNVYAYGSTGLAEYAPSGTSIVRGTFPISSSDVMGWNVGADGTVYLLQHVRRPSTIHAGDQADDLLLLHLPHGSLTWSTAHLVTSNEGYGFYRVGFATSADGSLHAAYMLGGIKYLRSHDGVTWDAESASDYASHATMVDFAPGNEQIDPPDRPADVNGYVNLIVAPDYDHVAITLDFATSSLYTSSYYELRRCAPFIGLDMTWPAERFAFAESDTGEAAIDEHGLASIMTPFGLRVDVAP